MWPVSPGLWAPDVSLLTGLSLGLSMFSPGWGLLGTEKIPFAKQKPKDPLFNSFHKGWTR